MTDITSMCSITFYQMIFTSCRHSASSSVTKLIKSKFEAVYIMAAVSDWTETPPSVTKLLIQFQKVQDVVCYID